MAIIPDYLKWRGDIPFSVSPFNDVDNYIVSKIGCPDFSGIVPSDKKEIAIGEAVVKYHKKYGSDVKLGALASNLIIPMLTLLPATERFARLKLSGYVNKVDSSNVEQFSALTVTLPDGTHYVSFRGTDDTLIAWKENFNMSVKHPVPAQLDALEYLKKAAAEYDGKLIVGGHSKGGNLAVYASVNAQREIQDRIVHVYSNDGPGFTDEFYKNDGYAEISDRITTILPYYSTVGVLLKQGSYTVVKCGRAGPASHDGYFWETQPDGFVQADSLSKSSLAMMQGISELVHDTDDSELQDFIDDFFGILESTGATSLSDFTEMKLKNALKLAGSMGYDKSVRRFTVNMLENIAKDYEQLSSSHNSSVKIENL